MNIVRVSCLPFPSCTSRRCRSTISTCARQYYSRSASLSLYHKNDVNREYERSGFTLSAGTSRGFPSRRQLTRQPAAVDALGFRRRPSEAHFIHGTTASVPSAPIPLFLPLLLALPMAPLSLSICPRSYSLPLSSSISCSSFFGMFVSPRFLPSLSYFHLPLSRLVFILSHSFSSRLPPFFSFLEMSRVYSQRELGFICILELRRT